MHFTPEELTRIFGGKAVAITHTGNPTLKDGRGICKAFHWTDGGGMDMETMSGNRWGFHPDTLTESSVEGDMAKFIPGRRKISLA